MVQCNICELYDYADAFWKEKICEIFLPMNNIRYVPIRIRETIKGHTGVCDFTKLGTGTNFAMVLVSTKGKSSEECRRIIRHELIHLALGLMNLKSDDKCAAFKFLCELFDANFYEKIEGLEKDIYSFYKGYFEECVEICKNTTTPWFNIGQIIEIIGDKNLNDVSMIRNKESQAKLILNVINTLKNR